MAGPLIAPGGDMAQCENHESFFALALTWDWLLWEYGTDTSCENYPKQVPIWFRHCPWDKQQREPVGCLCCTDLNEALAQWHHDLRDFFESRAGKFIVSGPEPKAPVNNALPFYQAR